MCMKYEKEYDDCFDYMFFSLTPQRNIVNFLNEHWNMVVVDEEKFRQAVYTLIEMCHEEIIIEPILTEGVEEWKI